MTRKFSFSLKVSRTPRDAENVRLQSAERNICTQGEEVQSSLEKPI
jgi:hypothetical protein